MFIFPEGKSDAIPYSGSGSFLELVASGQVNKVTQRGQALEIETKQTDSQSKPIVKTSNVPSELATNVQTDITNACQPPTCTSAPQVVGAPASDGGQWISLLVTAFLPILL